MSCSVAVDDNGLEKNALSFLADKSKDGPTGGVEFVIETIIPVHTNWKTKLFLLQ